MKGYISEDALAQYSKLAAEKEGLDFSEGETYDFARCVRADGSFYGTSGKCRKGSETGEKEKEAPKTAGGRKRRKTAEAKAEAKAASRAAAGAKVSANASRTRLLKEELEKVKDKMKGASPEEQNRLIQEASRKASERAAAGKETDREKVEKMKRTADQLTPKEKEARAARQKEGEANRQAQAGTAAAATREGKRKGNESPKGRELRQAQEQLFDAAKERRARAKEAERVAKEVAKRAKEDPNNKELKVQAREAGRAWDRAATAADRAQRGWMKAHDKWSKQAERDRRALMSPEQQKEERRVDRVIKERG